MSIKVKFWGVRGSIACPSPNHVIYGGNTSCVEINARNQPLIFDAGTGIRNLGLDFLKRGITDSVLLLTHTHWDHINGFPFFCSRVPARPFLSNHGRSPDRTWGSPECSGRPDGMANPMFPVPLKAMKAKLVFEDFRYGDSFNITDDIEVVTASLNHPNGATGYRINHGGRSVCYVTDTEHVLGASPTRLSLA